MRIVSTSTFMLPPPRPVGKQQVHGLVSWRRLGQRRRQGTSKTSWLAAEGNVVVTVNYRLGALRLSAIAGARLLS